VSELVKSTIASRLAGDKPSPVKSALVSAVAGAVMAAVTYRVLRS
jgi:hypothetical protein